MFILLDTGYLSSFENYALKISVREKINLKHSESLNTLPPAKRSPHMMGFFISVELCDGNFDLALYLSKVPE